MRFSTSRFVSGEPATFLTQRETAWKVGLRGELERFHVPSIDNLAKPVFDVLRKPQVEFVDVSVRRGPDPGVWVQGVSTWSRASAIEGFWMRRLLVGSHRHDGVDPALRDVPPIAGVHPLRVHVVFYEPVLLTDFGFEGSIKPVLDRLWPVIGGTSSRPADYRIRHLTAKYSDQRLTGVSVAIEELEESRN